SLGREEELYNLADKLAKSQATIDKELRTVTSILSNALDKAVPVPVSLGHQSELTFIVQEEEGNETKVKLYGTMEEAISDLWIMSDTVAVSDSDLKSIVNADVDDWRKVVDFIDENTPRKFWMGTAVPPEKLESYLGFLAIAVQNALDAVNPKGFTVKFPFFRTEDDGMVLQWIVNNVRSKLETTEPEASSGQESKSKGKRKADEKQAAASAPAKRQSTSEAQASTALTATKQTLSKVPT
ncbi:hypothetical protein HDU96_005386, partial [Phlyctochytrium bullatum]